MGRNKRQKYYLEGLVARTPGGPYEEDGEGDANCGSKAEEPNDLASLEILRNAL